MSSTLWITGAAGFSAGHLIAFLEGLDEKPRTVGLDRVETAPEGLDAYHQVDLNWPESLDEIVTAAPPAWVIHLAGLMPPADEAAMWQVNVGGTAGLMQALASAGCKETRVLSIGSAAEYLPKTSGALTEDSPCGGASAYGRVKWVQTRVTLDLGRELGIPAMVARPFNLIGPGLSENLVAGWLCRQFARDDVDEVVVGNTQSARDFVDVRDAVAAYWLIVTQGRPGEIYNVCTGEPTKIETLLELLSEVSGRTPKIRVDRERFRASDVSVSYGDNGKIRRATAWQPRIALRDSMAGMLSYDSVNQER